MADVISTTVAINDNMTKGLKGIVTAVNQCISSLESMNKASGKAIDTAALANARRSIAQAASAFGEVEDATERARQSAKDYEEETSRILKAVKNIAKAASQINTVRKNGIGNTAKGLLDSAKSSISGAFSKDSMAGAAKGFVRTVENGVTGAVKGIAAAEKGLITGVSKGVVADGKGLAVAGTAAAAGISAAVGASVVQYADYEQLVGGVDTLFKDSSGTVQQYARNAFQTAGLSANDYMETVTGFSASMIQSLGGDTAKAAELSNQALIDMSDNANKMGTDMGSIQYAYQGFAKQNYTMLDNLKLGYGGTQEEMQRLLDDAEKWTGKEYDISSFADVTEAIHAIQDKMGITGATAAEANDTVSGSLNSMKAAWQNTLTDLVNGGDNLDSSIEALVTSATAFAGNIVPVIQKALAGLDTLVAQLAPVLISGFSQLVNTVLPPLMTSVVSLLQTLISSISENAPQLTQALISTVLIAVQGISTLLPDIMNAATVLIMGLIQGLSAAAPQLITSAVMMINTLVNGLISNLPMIIAAALQLILTLADGLIANLPTMIQSAITLIVGFIQGIGSMLPQIVQTGIQLLYKLIDGLIQAIPQLIAAIPQIGSAIWDGLTSINWIDLGKQIISAIWNGIKSLAGAVWDGIKSIFTGGDDTGEIDAAAENAGASYTTALNSSINATAIDTTSISSGLNMDLTMQGAQSASSWSNSFNASMSAEGAGLTAATASLGTSLNMDLTQQGTQSAASWSTGFTTGVSQSTAAATENCQTIQTTFSAMNDELTANADATAQSLTTTTETTGNIMLSSINSTIKSIHDAVTSGAKTVVDKINAVARSIEATLRGLNLSSIGRDMIQGLADGISDKQATAVAAARRVANAVNDEFRRIEDINSPSKVWHSYGAYLVEGLNMGVCDMLPKAQIQAEELTGAYEPEPKRFSAMRKSVSNISNSRKTINAPITVKIDNTNNFTSNTDIPRFTRRLANGIAERIGMQLEGATA